MILRDTFALELEQHRLDCLGSHGRLDIYDFLVEQRAHLNDRPHLVPPLLTGHDLIALGVKPGREMGELLHEVRERQLEEEIHTADEAREWVRAKLAERKPNV